MTVQTEDTVHQRPAVLVTLAMLVGIVLLTGGLIGLYHLLGVGMPYFGFLFLLYWAAILKQVPMDFLPTVLGGLAGILLGWVLIALPALAGPVGIAVAVVLLVTVLFCYVRGQGLVVINNAMMLFLTVATISELNVAGNVKTMAVSFIIAAAYMGVITLAMHAVAKRVKRAAI
ncbi:MAG TPA: hypothetical protein VF463_20725 [Sphingobium sp.]